MDLVPQFNEFLANIRLTRNQVSDLKTGHTTLRSRLLDDPNLAPIIIATFLQGSYVRWTATRPKDEQRADADIIVVTNLDEESNTPSQAMERFRPFLDKWYEGKWRFQGRSIGISMSYVDLDIVLTSAPSEVEREALAKALRANIETLDDALDSVILEARSGGGKPAWKEEPLRIPDREAGQWEDTHPLAQIDWTREKNKRTNGHYVNVVKAIKWWRRLNPAPKYPKGYPVEHLVGVCCPDYIDSVAEGVTLSLEGMVDQYGGYAAAGEVPWVADHGVAQNVLGRVSAADFSQFMDLVAAAALTARQAYDSTSVEESGRLWRELFGSRFPEPPTPKRGEEGGPDGGFTPRTGPTIIGAGRYA